MRKTCPPTNDVTHKKRAECRGADAAILAQLPENLGRRRDETQPDEPPAQ